MVYNVALKCCRMLPGRLPIAMSAVMVKVTDLQEVPLPQVTVLPEHFLSSSGSSDSMSMVSSPFIVTEYLVTT